MTTSEWVESVGTRGAGGARVVADSISPWGHRLTTLEVTVHRSALAEFDLDPLVSRSCARSPAVPLAELLQRVRENPAVPVAWCSERAEAPGGDVRGPRISVARCARGSDLTHDGLRSVEADLALYEHLVAAEPYANPLEHVATPWNPGTEPIGPLGNLAGWCQLRHLVAHDAAPAPDPAVLR